MQESKFTGTQRKHWATGNIQRGRLAVRKKTPFDRDCFDSRRSWLLPSCLLRTHPRLLSYACTSVCPRVQPPHPATAPPHLLFFFFNNVFDISHPTVTIQKTRRLRPKRNPVVRTCLLYVVWKGERDYLWGKKMQLAQTPWLENVCCLFMVTWTERRHQIYINFRSLEDHGTTTF